jgi:hypothetical protein
MSFGSRDSIAFLPIEVSLQKKANVKTKRRMNLLEVIFSCHRFIQGSLGFQMLSLPTFWQGLIGCTIYTKRH